MPLSPSITRYFIAALLPIIAAITLPAQADEPKDLNRQIMEKESYLKMVKGYMENYKKEMEQDRATLAKINREIADLEARIREHGSTPLDKPLDTRHEGLKKRDGRLIPMTNEARGAIARVMAGGKLVGTAFAGQLMGKDVIFCPIHLVNEHKNLSFTNQQGQNIEIEGKVISPKGIPMIGFPTAKPLVKKLELCDPSGAAKASDTVFVLMVSQKSNRAEGYQCVIRGVGPDVCEVEGYVNRAMLGCPAISMNSGKVIGFITETVDGASALWAYGTRHQQSRYFVARADLLKDSREVELGRIHREATWLKDYLLEVHLADTCLRYLQGGRLQHDSMTLDEHADHPFVKDLRPVLRDRLKGDMDSTNPFCRKMVQSLKAKSKMSGNFTWNNEQIYQANLKHANHLIEGFKKKGGIRD